MIGILLRRKVSYFHVCPRAISMITHPDPHSAFLREMRRKATEVIYKESASSGGIPGSRYVDIKSKHENQ